MTKIRIRPLATFILLLSALSVCGCSGALRDACDATNSAVGVAGAYVDEAQFAVDRARDVAASMPDSLKPKAINAVNVAEAALFAVTQAATTASQQCASFDLAQLFSDFANAWQVVKDILDKTGGGASGIIDPKAYDIGKKAE